MDHISNITPHGYGRGSHVDADASGLLSVTGRDLLRIEILCIIFNDSIRPRSSYDLLRMVSRLSARLGHRVLGAGLHTQYT